MLQLIQVNQEGNLMNEIRLLFREYEKELDENLCFQSFEEELKNPLKKYSLPRGVLYIAEWNKEVAGCIALMPLKVETECEMKRLYVRPKFRSHHVGKALVEQLLKDAAALGYTKMKLDTLQKLQAAISLYKKAGFVETAAYYENPLDAVIYMEKILF
jgi:putative acetyltransferase